MQYSKSQTLHPDSIFLQVHITSRCNLTCKHCYSDGKSIDMPIEVLRETLEQFSDLKNSLGLDYAYVQLTGGEPLVHPQFLEMLKTAADYFPIRLLSNGTLINSAMAQMLSKYCKSVQISLDGTQAIHDEWRGEGSYSAAVRALDNLSAAEVRTSVRVTAAKDNQDYVLKLFEDISSRTDAFNVSRVVPIGNCSAELPDTGVYRKIIYDLHAASFKTSAIKPADPFFGVLMKIDQSEQAFCGCSAGIAGICVTETGEILPCRRLSISLGNVNVNSLREVYTSHPLMVSLRERELSGKCGDCEDKFRCGGSRCIAYALTGDPLAHDPGCIFV